VPAKKRQPEYPNVPTFAEVGVSGFDFTTWFVLTAPPGTPKDIITRLNNEVVKAMADPAIKERYAALGLVPNANSPEEVLAMTRDQLARYGKVIRDTRPENLGC
jgi:tripartite-type tricarboxylate transporter receptor subunit TctC